MESKSARLGPIAVEPYIKRNSPPKMETIPNLKPDNLDVNNAEKEIKKGYAQVATINPNVGSGLNSK